MSRITRRDGNVIAADFRPKPQIEITFDTQVLYCDQAVCLIRITYRFNGEAVGIQHVTHEAQPNNTDVTR